MIVKCRDPKDRDSLVVILARNGYTVRMGSKKLQPQDKQRTPFVEIVEQEGSHDRDHGGQ